MISSMTHPTYDALLADWTKFRFVYEGGHDFVEEYLAAFSKRESTTDFEARKAISYSPSHAKAALVDIKNAIYQRMVDITRVDGPNTYQKAIIGELQGVDLAGNNMNSFIGTKVLPELISMGKVGVYIDKASVEQGVSRAVTRNIHPYLYFYQAEDILSWSYDLNNQLTSVLLRDHTEVKDEETGLTVAIIEQYRLLRLTDDGVLITVYDSDSAPLVEAILLNLEEIPFVIFDIGQSLLVDVADYQISLLNLASSDMSYALKSNFPFYTEQFSPQSELVNVRSALANETTASSGEASQAAKASNNEIQVGVTQGRRYPKGLERPGFIHPSSEPLLASMDKQKMLKEEIRQLINLSLSNISPSRSSAASKEFDERGLESGLAYIGLELEHGERRIATIWSGYEKSRDIATIKYPTRYNLRTDEDRLREAAELDKRVASVPSVTYQKAIAKQIASVTIGHKISNDVLQRIYDEIDSSAVVVTNPDIIIADHEAGFVSTMTASKARGYAEGEVEQAKKDHAERASRIALAQSKAGARGVADLSANVNDGKDEKKEIKDGE